LHSAFSLFQVIRFLFKEKLMSTAELKIDLFRRLEFLDKKKLMGVYQLIINYIDKSKGELDDLLDAQKDGIYKGLNQLREDKGIYHTVVMKKYRSKFSDE
jgi:hypothetical protein